jgi:hypothetical protein
VPGYSSSSSSRVIVLSFLPNNSIILNHTSQPIYKTPTTPMTAAPTTAPIPTVPLPAPPVLPLPVVCAAAALTCRPKAVVTTALPLTVVVTTLVAVVVAEHPAHVVHGAAVLHGPAVHPGQSDAGHALVPHHAVQGSERQSLRVDHSDQGP